MICLQRENAVKKLLDVIGPEDPVIARSLDSFLLRGCYGVNSIHNAVHGNNYIQQATYSHHFLDLIFSRKRSLTD